MNGKDTLFSKKRSVNCGGRLLDLSEPKIVGIINATPDSFYAGSRKSSADGIRKLAAQLLSEGAHALEIGAVSSRPGSESVSAEVEWERLSAALDVIRCAHPDVLLFVDTTRAEIVQKAFTQFRIDVINDITAGLGDPEMFGVCASLRLPVVLMHMQGAPLTMQANPAYDDVVTELIGFFNRRIEAALASQLNDLILDVGFGFGKTLSHNYELLRDLDIFGLFGLPILVGVSRKSMVSIPLGLGAEEALNGTTVLNTLALTKGADLLRVHDARPALEAITLWKLFKGQEQLAK